MSASQESSFSQDIDIPRDNVLAALALGLHGGRALSLVSNIDRVGSFERSFDRDIDLDDDDVLLLLALDGGGLGFRRALAFDRLFDHDDFFDDDDLFDDDLDLFDDFDDDIFFDVRASSRAERALHRSVDLSDDDVLAALALGADEDDFWRIADIEFASSASIDRMRDVSFDDDDWLLWLALD